MINLKETAQKNVDTAINIAPQHFAIPPAELIPHRIEAVNTKLPLASYVTDKFTALAIREYIRKGVPLDQAREDLLTAIIGQSRLMESNYIAFDMVRRAATTGFEGYGAGTFFGAQDMAEAIAKLGVGVLQNMKVQKSKSGDHLFMQRLWKTLSGEKVEPEMVAYLYGQLGALISQLKAETQDNRPVDAVRQAARGLAERVPAIVYELDDNQPLTQRYVLPKQEQILGLLQRNIPVESVSPLLFNGRPEMWGYVFMMRLGMFGHPLMRTAITKGILTSK